MIKNIDKIVIKQTILAMDRHLENFNRKSHVHLKLIGMYFRKKNYIRQIQRNMSMLKYQHFYGQGYNNVLSLILIVILLQDLRCFFLGVVIR